MEDLTKRRRRRFRAAERNSDLTAIREHRRLTVELTRVIRRGKRWLQREESMKIMVAPRGRKA